MHQPTMGRRTFVKGSLAASALAALAACGKKGGSDTTATSGEATGGTLNYYINNPVSIDPYDAEEDQGMQVCYQALRRTHDVRLREGRAQGPGRRVL